MLRKREKGKINKRLMLWIAALLAIVLSLTAMLFAGGFIQHAARAVAAAFSQRSGESPAASSAPSSVGVIDPDSLPLSSPEPESSGEGTGGGGAEIPFAKPEKIRGAWLVPGTDFLTGGADYAAAMSQWEQALKGLKDYHFNTAIVPAHLDGKALYSNASDGGYVLGAEKKNLLRDMLVKARENGIYVYCVYAMPQNVSMDVLTARTLSAVRDIAGLSPDGLFLRDYHQSAAPPIYAQYMSSGGGMGLDSYIRDQLTALMKRASAAVKSVNKKLYFGAAVHPVWAVKSGHPDGLDASADFTALDSGHADTFGWLNAGLLDCVMVENDRSTETSGAGFVTVAKWWAEAAEKAGRDVLFSHFSDKVAKKAAGFEPDQLIKQAIALEEIKNAGSVFNSYSALRQDTTGSTVNLIKYYEGKVEPSYILRDLSVSSPSKTTFTTNESTLTIRGASDPNFPLTVNGKEAERSDMGFFSLNVSLKPGVNTYRFEHKGKTVTYTITYKLIIIKDYFPAADQSVRGSTTFNVTAVALGNASVTATLGGTTVKLTPAATNEDNPGSTVLSGSFITYTGAFQIPAAKPKQQDLGKITFKASHSGQTVTKTGGRVTVKADENAAAPGGGEYANINGEYAAEVIIEQAETFNGKTTDDYSNPLNSYLPKGTVDYCDPNPVNGPGGKYHLWRFGKRTYLSSSSTGTNIKVYKAKLPETNSVTIQSVTADARHTTLTLDTIWKAPFQLAYDGTGDYANPSPKSGAPSFEVKNSFTAKYVDVTFCYAAMGQGVADFGGDNPIFSSAEWFKGDRDYTLRLHLKKPGVFFGWSANYNSAGQLEFKFLHPAKINGNSLSGTKIIIDPGHGGKDPGALGFHKESPPEKELALKISQKLRDNLASMGAQVIMTRDKDLPSTAELKMRDRTALTHEIGPDLFISVHLNASKDGSARGYDNFYFTPFSKKFASAVFGKASQPFAVKRKVNWYPFFVTRVTDCPSILTENGFVDNSNDYEWLLQEGNQAKIADGTAQGILDYFKSIQ